MEIENNATRRAGDTAPRSSDTRGSSRLGKDEFVKLLMAQISHQDPLSPSDSSAFVAQLAQFASVEQMQTANSRLEGLLVAQAANNQTTTASLVGKDVYFKTDAVTLAEGKPTDITATLAKDAGNVTANVVDSTGKVVRTIELGARNGGALEFAWDGKDDGGTALPGGAYKVRINATDPNGKSVDVEQHSRSRVTGVSFRNGYPELVIGAVKIKMSEVIEISEPAQRKRE